MFRQRPRAQSASSEPHAEDMAFPCCNAFTHLPCLVRCAQLHGTCPNCRAAIDHLPREPAIAARCEALGINMHAPSAPAPDTAFAVVRDYAMRTFSRADAAEPLEPVHIRAACCNRLAGPALDFAELPDARMHWAPLNRRGTKRIGSWHAAKTTPVREYSHPESDAYMPRVSHD